jgi:hypothetical protein
MPQDTDGSLWHFLPNNPMIIYSIQSGGFVFVLACFRSMKSHEFRRIMANPALSLDQIVLNHTASFFGDKIDNISNFEWFSVGNGCRMMLIPFMMLARALTHPDMGLSEIRIPLNTRVNHLFH